jgi:hypothetical protein
MVVVSPSDHGARVGRPSSPDSSEFLRALEVCAEKVREFLQVRDPDAQIDRLRTG